MLWKKAGKVIIVGFCFQICLSWASHGYAQENKETSLRDLREMVSVMEDPQKRDAFLKEIKGLIRVHEAVRNQGTAAQPAVSQEKKGGLFIEHLFTRFDELTNNLIGGAKGTLAWLWALPKGMGEAVSSMRDPETRGKVFRLLISLFLAALAGGLVKWALRKYPGKGRERTANRFRDFLTSLGHSILNLVPYGAVLLFLFILFKVFPSFRLGQNLFLLFFQALFFYRVTAEVFSCLLSPDDPGRRIISINDENASYLWVWALRFARYAVFTILLTQVLQVTRVAPLVFSFARGALYVVFPFMITIFILQVARDLKATLGKSGEQPPEKGRAPWRGAGAARRFIRYGALLTIAYTWAVFLFLIFHYHEGFHYLFEGSLWSVVSALALFLALHLQEWVFKRFFAINERVKARLPGLEEKTNRYIAILGRSLRWALTIVALGVVAQIWGIPVSAFLGSETGRVVLVRVVTILMTAGIVLAVVESSRFLSRYYLREKTKGKDPDSTQKLRTLVPVIDTVVRVAAAFVGGIIVLDRLGVNTAPILAGAGILGLAVGFGSQALVKDLINGLFMLFEESIRVGDWIVLGNKSGLVESIGLRKVRLRGLEGNVHIIPNSSVDVLTNMTKEFSRYVLDVGVAYREDVDEVMGILKEIGDELYRDPKWGQDMLEPLEIFGLDRFDDSAVIIRARLITKPLKQWGLGREFNLRMKRVFDERGIEIPFPHRTIYMGEPKKGSAAPMRVKLEAAGT